MNVVKKDVECVCVLVAEQGWSQGLKGQEKQGTLQRALRAKALPLQRASAMERAVG